MKTPKWSEENLWAIKSIKTCLFFLSRPLPFDDVTEFIERDRRLLLNDNKKS